MECVSQGNVLVEDRGGTRMKKNGERIAGHKAVWTQLQVAMISGGEGAAGKEKRRGLLR